MTNTTSAREAPTPILQALKIDKERKPYLEGSKCRACGYIYLGNREICAKCFARGDLEEVRLAEVGKLYTWAIVHRSFPGVETPFIDVIVDLDDGAHIKGVLKGVTPEPDAIEFDMPVRVVFEEVVPPGSDRMYLAYHFVPSHDRKPGNE